MYFEFHPDIIGTLMYEEIRGRFIFHYIFIAVILLPALRVTRRKL